ncbi:hypothetical protein [Spiroplasma endosymbiont of Crioceris asparagi]|uniref:hypothetical protein n=1 Tax=Spiroplasma endosymbiont of Crioceris asparagi TaxID=3066286 RepID=UPI0030D39AB9
MVNQLRKNILEAKDIKYLGRVIPFWKKSLNKSAKKLNKWNARFNNSGDINMLITVKGTEDLEKYLTKLNNYINFFNQKYKKIKTDKKVLSKFKKYIGYYMQNIAIASSLNHIAKFLKDIEFNNLTNQEKANYFNKYVWSFFNQYIVEVKRIIGDDYFINTVISNIDKKNENELINFRRPVNLIINYVRKLNLNKKISDVAYLDFVANTVEFVHFFYAYLTNIEKFMKII